MKIYNLTLLFIAAIALFISCDDGKIYETGIITGEEGIVVKITGNIDGLDKWATGYNVAVAGFGDSEYAVVSKNITTINENSNQVEIVMSGVTTQVKTIELCAIDRLRKRIVSFKTIDCDLSSDTLLFNVDTIDAGMFNAIQQSVFNVTCANCHGGSNYAAAGLVLTEGKSYDALVNIPSKLNNGELLINPGEASSSTLYTILSSDISSSWGYDHSVEVLSTSTLDLIKSWIDSGAQK